MAGHVRDYGLFFTLARVEAVQYTTMLPRVLFQSAERLKPRFRID
jgi:hypothetical protein